MSRTLEVKVLRQADPHSGSHWETFDVAYEAGMNVTTVMQRIAANPVTADHRDTTPVAYDACCLEEVCGACTMVINDRVRQACSALVDTLLADCAGVIEVRPMTKFPVIRDLIVDIGDFMRKLTTVKPWIIREEEKPLSAGEYRQTPQELDDYKQYSMCINCMLCYSACPVYGLDPHFIGPAVIALAQRYNLDSRDEGAAERMAVLSEHDGLWGCTFVGECTKVCPKHVDPAGSIQRYKLTAAVETVKAFFMPRGA